MKVYMVSTIQPPLYKSNSNFLTYQIHPVDVDNTSSSLIKSSSRHFQDLGIPLLLVSYSEQSKQCINNQCLVSSKRGSTKLPTRKDDTDDEDSVDEIPTLTEEAFDQLFSAVSKKPRSKKQNSRRTRKKTIAYK